jgi:magnesium transporter
MKKMHLPQRSTARRLHGKQYHPPGTPPGTLQAALREAPAPQYRLMEFDRDGCQARDIDVDGLHTITLSESGIVWLDVAGLPDEAQFAALGRIFGLHRLALEDVLNQGQRPKLDDYDDRMFVVLARPLWCDGEVHLEQVNLFLGHNFVISIGPATTDPFAPVRLRLQQRTRRFLEGGAGYLLHALIDLTIDECFPVLDALGEDIEATELELLEHPDQDTLAHIHVLKRELLWLRRQLWPAREVMQQLLRSENPLLQAPLVPYLKDIHDHSVYLIDLVESYRDMTAGMLEVYLSSVSYRLNDIMRLLTIISTIFIPLTFLTSVYGMNFIANTASPWAMPELYWYYGYPLLWLIILCVAGGMLLLFRRKRWL